MKNIKNKPVITLRKKHFITVVSGIVYVIATLLYYICRSIDNKIAATVFLIIVVMLAIGSLITNMVVGVKYKEEKEDEGAQDSFNKGLILSKGIQLILVGIIVIVWWLFGREKVFQVTVADFAVLWYCYTCIGEIITSITFLILDSPGRMEDEE